MKQDGLDGIVAFDFAESVGYGKQVQVMIAQDGLDTAFVCHDELEGFQ
ncbi:hypothetical protein l11_03380 [Neisseria weaveri LMG 5135]|nr:hypothetical protein l11_03380 [Neisseria weaveri LMG 5135]